MNVGWYPAFLSPTIVFVNVGCFFMNVGWYRAFLSPTIVFVNVGCFFMNVGWYRAFLSPTIVFVNVGCFFMNGRWYRAFLSPTTTWLTDCKHGRRTGFTHDPAPNEKTTRKKKCPGLQRPLTAKKRLTLILTSLRGTLDGPERPICDRYAPLCS